MRVNYRLRNVQPQSGAGLVKSAALVALVETLKNVRNVLRLDALTLVVDRDKDLFLAFDYPDTVLSAVARELDRVIADVVKYLIDSVAVSPDVHIFIVRLKLHVQLLPVDLLLERQKYHPRHLADVECLHSELSVARLNP